MPLAKLDAFEDGIVRLSAFAKALSHPARIEILRLLSHGGELCCSDIVAALPLSQPASSRHIAELVKAGLLNMRTYRSQVFYRLEGKALDQFCRSMASTLHS
jgi:ArsR family transcriptional regulator, arsenate/arsenite/antimonite-responsive transcriptional repressor